MWNYLTCHMWTPPHWVISLTTTLALWQQWRYVQKTPRKDGANTRDFGNNFTHNLRCITQIYTNIMSPKNDVMICFQENPVMNFSHPWETHDEVLPIATCAEIWTFGRIAFVCASWNIGVDTFDSLKKQKTVLFNISLTVRAEGADPPWSYTPSKPTSCSDRLLRPRS